jgi:alcohol dehydrogenase class IV
MPEKAINDPVLMVSTLPKVSISSRMDALTYAVERYLATRDAHTGEEVLG